MEDDKHERSMRNRRLPMQLHLCTHGWRARQTHVRVQLHFFGPEAKARRTGQWEGHSVHDL